MVGKNRVEGDDRIMQIDVLGRTNMINCSAL